MSVLKSVDPSEATGLAKELFERIETTLNRVPAMIRVMANSPAIVDTYLHFNHALAASTLSPRMLALITVAVAEINGCDYTLSTGMALAKRHSVPEPELHAARVGRGLDNRTAETLAFARKIVRRHGRVPQADVERLRAGGFSDQEIVDIVAAVGLNVFRNYFNLVAGTDIDVPVVRAKRNEPRSTAAATAAG